MHTTRKIQQSTKANTKKIEKRKKKISIKPVKSDKDNNEDIDLTLM